MVRIRISVAFALVALSSTRGLAGLFGIVAATITASLLNRVRLSRFMASPPLVFLALAVIYTCVIGTFLIPV